MSEVKGVANVWEGSPDWPTFRALMAEGPEMTRTGPGAVQYDSYIAFYYSVRLIGAYSFVSASTLYSEGNFLIKDRPLQQAGDGSLVKYKYLSTKTTLESMESPGVSIDKAFDKVLVTDACVISVPLGKADQGTIAVNMWGTRYDSRTEDGLFFEYFPGLLEADSSYGPAVIQRLMFRILARDADLASQNMVDIRNGFRALVHHRGGEQLTHALIGCSLAEQAQCMLQLVEIKGVYRGFVLVGKFNLLIRGKIISPESRADLRDSIRKLSKHESSIKTIMAIISAKVLDDGSQKYSFRLEEIKSSWAYRSVFLALDSNDFTADEKKNIISLTDDLDFGGATYASSKFSNVKLFLDYVRTGDILPLKSYDTFFMDGQIWRSGRVAVGLSIFGTFPPSVSIGRGPGSQKFQIPFRDEAVDSNLQIIDGKRRIPFLPYKRKIISESINEWNKLLSTGLLVLPPGNEKKKEFVQSSFKDGAYGGGEFLVAYNAIRDVYKTIGSEKTEDGKRKNADDIDEGGASKRGKKSKADAKGKAKAMME